MNDKTTPSAADAENGTEHRNAPGSKSRPISDASRSEATRDLRDKARRRRDAEEKLRQHLMEAKEHVPHHRGTADGTAGAEDEAGDESGDHDPGDARD